MADPVATVGPSVLQWVRAQRDERAWSTYTLARFVGLPETTVRAFVVNGTEIRSDALEKILRAFGAWPPRPGADRV